MSTLEVSNLNDGTTTVALRLLRMVLQKVLVDWTQVTLAQQLTESFNVSVTYNRYRDTQQNHNVFKLLI